MAPKRPPQQCSCSYKCGQAHGGFVWVSYRTWQNHQRLAASGLMHSTVRPRVRRREHSPPTVSSPQQTTRYVLCTCAGCNSTKMRTVETCKKHMALELLKRHLHNFPTSSEENDVERNEVLGEGVEEPGGCLNGEVAPMGLDNIDGTEDVDSPRGSGDGVDTNMYGNAQMHHTSNTYGVSLDDALLSCVIELQSILDNSYMSKDSQGEILKVIFGSSGKSLSGSDREVDYGHLSLVELITLKGGDWDGNIHGFHIPASWKQLMTMYSSLGMAKAQRWKICFGSEGATHTPHIMKPHIEDMYDVHLECLCIPKSNAKYRRDCAGCGQKCEICHQLRKHCLVFDYMLIENLINALCHSRTRCHEFLTLWRNSEDWKGHDIHFQPESIKEFWHGSKLREYQGFWDPEAFWEGPQCCPNKNCKRAFRAFPISMKCEELLEPKNWNEARQLYSFPCTECGELVEGPCNLHQGDPRNFAIMAHWDGFQSARTQQRDCWTLEVSFLNCGKHVISSPYPILFIPSSSAKLIKEGSSSVLTSFLEPFVAELEQLFAEGFKTRYSYSSEFITDKLEVHEIEQPIILRAILLNFTGDHPAQSKIGCLKSGGFLACRRHNLFTNLETFQGSAEKCVYEDTRQQARFPPPVRSVQSLWQCVTEWRELPRGQERLRVARLGGISGYSILWRLYHLYGFDLTCDLVYDTMHVLALCVFKKYVHLLVKTMTELNQEAELEAALITVSKPTCRPKGLGDRWPRKLSSLGFYKAEEYTIFILWCLPYILDKLRIEKTTILGGLGVLLIEIGRLFYIHSRRYGWNQESMSIAKTMLAAWRVRSEESLGPNNSPLEHIAGSGELFDDVVRHGSHDIFWCYGFEREVLRYKRIPTNHKSNEISYTSYYERVCFTHTFTAIQKDLDGLLPTVRGLLQIHKYLQLPNLLYRPAVVNNVVCAEWHKDCVVVVGSRDMARELSRMLPQLHQCTCLKMIQEKGILVGAVQQRNPRQVPVQMNANTRTYLLQYWRDMGVLSDQNVQFFREEIRKIRFLLLDGREYEVGSLVVVQPDRESNTRQHHWMWKAKIMNIFVHEFEGRQEVFFTGKYYEQRVESSSSIAPLLHDITNMQILNSQPMEVCVRPIQQLMYKFMALPMEPIQDGRQFLVAYELEDVKPRRHLLLGGQPGCCPPFPVVGDVMMVLGTSNESFLYAVIRGVHGKARMQVQAEAIDGVVEERHHLVGTVDISYLQRCGPRSSRYVASAEATETCSWHKLVQLLCTIRPIRFSRNVPVEWLKL